MGKEKPGFLTPKAISNRIKSKGLQKLRWYCQMCQKQCRDENGFKCHAMSESHQRQLLLVAEDPNKFLGTFSHEFFLDFIQLLKTRFGTRRVHANVVYQEYISDRNHLHMNSTHWVTLTGFVKFLGKNGHCKVDQTEKGWFITYIDRDPETIARQEALARKDKMALDDEERLRKFIAKQIEKDKNDESTSQEDEGDKKELRRDNEDERVTFALPTTSKATSSETIQNSFSSERKITNPFKLKSSSGKESESIMRKGKNKPEKRRLGALQEIIEEEESKKKKATSTLHKVDSNNKEYCWLEKGIVLKIVSKKYGDNLYKQKGVVKNINENEKKASLQLIGESDDHVVIDQQHLETVIPAIGKEVLILRGKYRGCSAVLEEIMEKDFSVRLLLEREGKILEKIPYENISKLYS